MRRMKLENLVTTGKFEEQRSWKERNRHFTFLVHVTRRHKLENLVVTGKFKRKRNTGK